MEELKRIIETTLINNLDTEDLSDNGSVVDLDTIKTCSDYIEKEIKDIAMEFSLTCYKYIKDHGEGNTTASSRENLFEQFIEDRYKA